jgi:hypothetical protein
MTEVAFDPVIVLFLDFRGVLPLAAKGQGVVLDPDINILLIDIRDFCLDDN